MSLVFCDRKPLYRSLQEEPFIQTFLKDILLFALLFLALMFCFVEPSFAGGTGNSAAVQTRVTSVAAGWQAIVSAVGVSIFVMGWLYVAYQINFGTKTMKDMWPPALGSTLGGLATALVPWLFA
jgi:hypothetical protein